MRRLLERDRGELPRTRRRARRLPARGSERLRCGALQVGRAAVELLNALPRSDEVRLRGRRLHRGLLRPEVRFLLRELCAHVGLRGRRVLRLRHRRVGRLRRRLHRLLRVDDRLMRDRLRLNVDRLLRRKVRQKSHVVLLEVACDLVPQTIERRALKAGTYVPVRTPSVRRTSIRIVGYAFQIWFAYDFDSSTRDAFNVFPPFFEFLHNMQPSHLFRLAAFFDEVRVRYAHMLRPGERAADRFTIPAHLDGSDELVRVLQQRVAVSVFRVALQLPVVHLDRTWRIAISVLVDGVTAQIDQVHVADERLAGRGEHARDLAGERVDAVQRLLEQQTGPGFRDQVHRLERERR